MSEKIVSLPLDCAQSYEEIGSLYNLYLNSTDCSDLYHQLIKQKIAKFLKENHIHEQDKLEVLNRILNQIKEDEKKIGNIPPAEPNEQYLGFLKKIDTIKRNLKDALAIQDYHTKKVEFEKIMRKKPSLEKATELRYLMKSEEIEEMLQAYDIWGQKVQEYLVKYDKDIFDDGEFQIESSQIREMTKGISQIKEEMNLLVLRDEDWEREIWIFEWMFQAKLFMSSGSTQGLPRSDIKYWKDLEIRAQEGKHQVILESERYHKICKEVVKYERLSEQVKEIEDQLKLKDQESIESLLKELMESKVLTLKEERFLQGILDQAEKGMKEYKNLKESHTFIPIKKFRSIVKQLQKVPMKLPQEIEEQILKEERINELLKEIIGKLKPSFDVAKKIYKEYKGFYLDISEAQKIFQDCIQAFEMFQTITDVLQRKRSLNYKEICELESQVENSPFDFGSDVLGKTKVKIWLAQVDLIRMFKKGERIPEKPIHFEKISECLTKGYDLISSIPNDEQKMLVAWTSAIKILTGLVEDTEVFFAKISNSEDPRKEKFPFSHFIDIDLEEQIKRKVLEPSSLLKKRRAPSPFIETTVTTSLEMESEEESAKSSKKVKTEDGFFEEEKVSLVEREETRKKLLELIENLEGEVLKNPGESLKELEDKLIMACHWRRREYHERVEAVCCLLEMLDGFLYLRWKLFKRRFEYGEIEKCLKNNLEKLDIEASQEFRKPSSQNKIQQPKEENIFEKIQSILAPPPKLENTTTRPTSENKGKEAEETTEQIVQEIQNCDLFIRDENISFKNFENQFPLQNEMNLPYIPPFSTDFLDNLMFNALNTLPPIHPFENQNPNDNIKTSLDSNVKIEFDGLEDGEITHLVQVNRTQIEPLSSVNEKNSLKTNSQFGTFDKTIKRIFKGRISQQAAQGNYELEGSLHTYASSDFISQFPKLSIPELSFEQDLFPEFVKKLKSLQSYHKTSHFQKVLVGWVSVETENLYPFVFKKRSTSVGRCSDVQGVEIYLMPLSSRDDYFEELKFDLNWTFHENKSAFAPEQYLLFAICLIKSQSSHGKGHGKGLNLKSPQFSRPDQQTNIQNHKRKEITEGSEEMKDKEKSNELSKMEEEPQGKKKKKIWTIIRPEKQGN